MSCIPIKANSINAPDLEQQETPPSRGQTYVPRSKPGNPRPLGLFGFGISIFLVSLFGLKPRGITHNNLVVPELVLFGGLSQVIAGIVEFVLGDTFGATVFSSYGALTAAYGMIFIPGMGVGAAYTDPTTNEMSGEFNQAISLYFWAWAIVTTIFLVGSVGSSLVLKMLLVFAGLTLIFLAIGEMVGSEAVLTTAGATGVITAFLALWAGAADLWADRGIKIPTGDFSKRQ